LHYLHIRVNLSIMTIERTINQAWQGEIDHNTDQVRQAVSQVITALDQGEIRVCEQGSDLHWHVNQWVKKAILLSFRLHDNQLMPATIAPWYDKVPLKTAGWGEEQFQAAGFRAVPPCAVRRGSYIASNVVLMPSYVNIGAYVDEGTMVDTWATVGSCAQIGKNCHISGGAGIGGVLEPLQANPVIIEDDCFIGARSEVAEGVIIKQGSVLSMGVYIGASTKIVNRQTGEIHYGEVPPYSVVVPGSMPSASTNLPAQNSPSLYCAVIVKQVDAKTRQKTAINELLREG
jgi:2,3,4,5-tetrahydropyridine-2-carboxylate N-succinyltransferase